MSAFRSSAPWSNEIFILVLALFIHVMNLYLLEIRESVGDKYETINKVLVEATSRGYAKYHWHKMMNQQGSVKAQEAGDGGQTCHQYVNGDVGLRAKLENVRKVEGEEANVLEEVLGKIPGFDPSSQ